MTSATKWARGLSVRGSVRLVTCGDRSLTGRADRAVTDAQLSAWLKLNVQKELCASVGFFSKCVCVVCCTVQGRIWNGRQPSSETGAMPAASLPRDGALKLGSEAGEALEGHGTVTTQVAYVTWHSIYQMRFHCLIIIHPHKHTYACECDTFKSQSDSVLVLEVKYLTLLLTQDWNTHPPCQLHMSGKTTLSWMIVIYSTCESDFPHVKLLNRTLLTTHVSCIYTHSKMYLTARMRPIMCVCVCPGGMSSSVGQQVSSQ